MQEDVIEMEHMLDEYLDFARGEGGEDMQSTDLAEFVEDTVSAAQRAGADGRLRLDGAAPVVMSVRRQSLRRCLTNLIDNALKHGTNVAIGLHRNGRFAEILVDDDGPGIPETRREEAFRPFHRLDEGRNLQTGGVGLGSRHCPRCRARPWRRNRTRKQSHGRAARDRAAAGVVS